MTSPKDTWTPLPAGSLSVDPDIVRGFPDGTVDRSTYEDMQDALDRAEAPTKDGDRWLTLPERIAALAASMGPLQAAVGTLSASEVYLDDNHPWRIMLTRGKFHFAVAEQHPESTVGDGVWKDGKAICDIVNAAIAAVHTLRS